MNQHLPRAACAVLVLVAASCTSGNPGRSDTSRWKPQEPVVEPAPSVAAPEPAPSAEAPTPEPSAPESATSFGLQEAGAIPIVARVSDETIDVGELLDAWMQVNSRELREIFERLISAKLVEIEARRSGIALTPEQIEAGYQESIAELEAEFAKVAPGKKLDDWITGELGMDPAHYRANLRVDVVRQLLAPRVIRAFTLAHDRRNVRLIVTDTRAEIEDTLAEFRAGRDFGELVAERSIDPNKEDGGRIPAVLRGNSPISRLVFMTEVGTVGGPIQDSVQGRWLLVHVDSEEPEITGPWPEVRGRVEESLVAERITDPEYWQWKAEMARRHEVDTDPLIELMQAATKP